jgi:SAM-dependent methyltransferase
MEFLELKDISEQFMEIVNPSSADKLLRVGRALRLADGMSVIDFGCGYGEMLALWAEEFGIRGVGVDIRSNACDRARKKMAERGLADRVEIVCANGSQYAFEPGSYDAATCIGATFIWGGFGEAVRAMSAAVREGGKLAVGEVHWSTDQVPTAVAERGPGFLPESRLLEIAQEEGYDVECVVRAALDDWDRYESDNWVGLLRWIEANPDHPERQQVIDHLHKCQEEYFTYGREYFGWAIYVLCPASY